MPRRIETLTRRIYGLFSGLTFAVVTIPTICLLTITPGRQNRRLLVKKAASLIFFVTGVTLRVSRREHLPTGQCVIVANHASYLDGIILTAVLPPRFSFVIKREMTTVPLAHLLLRRLGSEFVERFDSHRGASDARRIFRKAHRGNALAFFPEGTFYAEPGLRRFRTGAFAAAARANLPVVPVVIRGARRLLPAEQWLPRFGPIDVEVTPPIVLPDSVEAHRASRLLQSARGRILERLDEPDMLARE